MSSIEIYLDVANVKYLDCYNIFVTKHIDYISITVKWIKMHLCEFKMHLNWLKWTDKAQVLHHIDKYTS